MKEYGIATVALCFLALCVSAPQRADAEKTGSARFQIGLDSFTVIDTRTGDTVLRPDELNYTMPAFKYSTRYPFPFYFPVCEKRGAKRGSRKLSDISSSPSESAWAAFANDGAGYAVVMKRTGDPSLVVFDQGHHWEHDSLHWSPDSRCLLYINWPTGVRIFHVVDSRNFPIHLAGGLDVDEHWGQSSRPPVWDMRTGAVSLEIKPMVMLDSSTQEWIRPPLTDKYASQVEVEFNHDEPSDSESDMSLDTMRAVTPALAVEPSKLLVLSTPEVLTLSRKDTASAFVGITTNLGNDTLCVGEAGAIIVAIDTGPYTTPSCQFGIAWEFSNATVKQDMNSSRPIFSEKAHSIFEWHNGFPKDGFPDTTFVWLIDVGSGPFWQGSGEVFRFEFTPSDTGRISLSLPLTPNPLSEVQYETRIWEAANLYRCHVPTIHVVAKGP
jgi:hypothetical protein